VQELAVVIAPKLLGGDLARTPLGDLGFTAMDQVIALSGITAQRLGSDLLLQHRLI
jgi:diaminohydroxyphosphoribosylaminopyrimidine deaminase/5-amino-6-(5-phosphoribosylamino)uracil reductase